MDVVAKALAEFVIRSVAELNGRAPIGGIQRLGSASQIVAIGDGWHVVVAIDTGNVPPVVVRNLVTTASRAIDIDGPNCFTQIFDALRDLCVPL